MIAVDGPVTPERGPGQLERGLVKINLALRLVELGLVGPGIDDEQQVPRLDFLAFLERHLDQVARHPRADVDRMNGLGSAGEVNIIGDFPPDRQADRYDRGLDRGDFLRFGRRRAFLRLSGTASSPESPTWATDSIETPLRLDHHARANLLQPAETLPNHPA